MRERELRAVLLIKAIEETDRTGAVIPAAERLSATRETKRDIGAAPSAPEVDHERSHLRGRAQRMLVARTNTLLKQLVIRHPFVERVLNMAGGLRWIGWLMFALSVLFGAALSALDGNRRIDIVAFPFLGLLAWNLLVYVLVFVGWVRSSRSQAPRRLLPRAITRMALRAARRSAAASRTFVAPLAEALERFTHEWFEASKPLLIGRATRVFHLCAI